MFITGGYILSTNELAKAKAIAVFLPKGGATLGEVERKDVMTNGALLKIDQAEGIPSLKIGDTKEFREGDTVYLIGNIYKSETIVLCKKAIVASNAGRLVFKEISRTMKDKINDTAQIRGQITPKDFFICTSKGEVVGFVPANKAHYFEDSSEFGN